MLKIKMMVFLLGFCGFALQIAKAEDYWQIPQDKVVATDNLYFTWLGCHSCLMIEQKVDLGGFDSLPLIARPEWRAAAKIQMAMQMMTLDDEIEAAFKQEILQQKINVTELNSMVEALVRLGVDQESLIETLNSRELFSSIQQAQDKAKHYQIRYVPTVVVKGRFATDAKHSASVVKFSETIAELKRK